MRKLAALLGIAGVGVWTLGIVAWISGVWVTMPPDQVKVLVLTVAALSGGALVAAGAVIGRAATTVANRELEDSSGLPALPASQFNAGEATANAVESRRETRVGGK